MPKAESACWELAAAVGPDASEGATDGASWAETTDPTSRHKKVRTPAQTVMRRADRVVIVGTVGSKLLLLNKLSKQVARYPHQPRIGILNPGRWLSTLSQLIVNTSSSDAVSPLGLYCAKSRAGGRRAWAENQVFFGHSPLAGRG